MKTAMQELLGLVEQMFNNAKTQEVESAMNDIINIITQEGIPREKRQLYHSFNCGADRVCEKEFNIWFNQTYNQNK